MFSKMKQTQIPLDDPSALANLGKLEVVARLVVEGFMMGQHKSPYKGTSVEFVEHRQYYPGDEVRHIDWRAFGKTGRYYVKEFEDETNLRCYLIVDRSGSMEYSGSTLSKFHYARQLSSALAYLLLRQRDAVGMVTFDTQERERVKPSAKMRNFHYLTEMLENSETGGETSLGPVLETLVSTFRRRSLVVILSDCFDDIESLMHALRQFRHARHDVILFQIIAPEELDFPFSKPTQFRSLERPGRRLLVDPHRLRSHYVHQFQEFCRELRSRSAGMGVDFHSFTTADAYASALGAFLDARSRRAARS